MILTTERIPNARPIEMVSASATYGAGFLTSIVMSICMLLGIRCDNYTGKLEAAEKDAKELLRSRAARFHADGVMDVRCQTHGLTFYIYGMAYKMDAYNPGMMQPPYQPAPPAPRKAPAAQRQSSTVDSVSGYWNCGTCNKRNVMSNEKCWNCGAVKAGYIGGSSDPDAAVAAIIDGDNKVCPVCNTSQKGDRFVCWRCGQKFSN